MRTATQLLLSALAVLACASAWRQARRAGGGRLRSELLVFGALGLGATVGTAVPGLVGRAALLGSALAGHVLLWLTRPATAADGDTPRSSRWSAGSWWVHALMLALWAWLAAIDLYVGQAGRRSVGAYAVAFVLFILVLRINAIGGMTYLALRTVLTAVLTASVASSWVVAAPWRDCDQFKCSALGGLYRGPFPSENFLAIVAAFGLAWCLADGRRRGWAPGAVLSLAVLLATGSRTSLIAVVAAVVWATLAAGVSIRRTGADGNTRYHVPLVASAVTAAAVVAVSVSLITDARQDSFSNRGNVWIRAYAEVAQGHLVQGLGLSSWTRLQEIGIIPAHFAHSQYLALLFSGGYVALVLFALLVTTLLTRGESASRARAGLSAMPTMLLMVAGLTEVIWNPLTVDGFGFLVFGVLVGSQRATSRPEAVWEDSSEPAALARLPAAADVAGRSSAGPGRLRQP